MAKSSRLVVTAVMTALLWLGVTARADAQSPRNPTMPSQDSDNLKEAVYAQFTEYRKSLNPAERKLAYPIHNETRGHYTYVVYTGKGDIVQEIERNLRLHEHVLRFLSVNLEKEFDPEAFTKRRAEIHAAAKRREEEREARREERMAERRGYGGYGGDDDDRGGYRRDRGERSESRPEPRGAAEGETVITPASGGSEPASE